MALSLPRAVFVSVLLAMPVARAQQPSPHHAAPQQTPAPRAPGQERLAPTGQAPPSPATPRKETGGATGTPAKPPTPPQPAPRTPVQREGVAPAARPPGAQQQPAPAHRPAAAQSQNTPQRPAAPVPAAPPVVPIPAQPEVPSVPPAPRKGSDSDLPLPRFAALRSDEVNLRGGPGLRYPISWVYKRRDLPVEIEREFDVWRLVRDPDGMKGWVHARVLTGRRTLVVTGAERPMRREPKDDAATVARLKPGVIARVRRCEAGSDWCEVQKEDYRGWMKRGEFWGTYPGEAVQ